MEKAKYCKCKETYTINCDLEECKAFYYWSQGIGDISVKTEIEWKLSIVNAKTHTL